jgi:DNA mismatch repair protein MutS2
MGISCNILDRARGYLDQDEVRLNNLIEKLNYLMTETTQEKNEVEGIKRKYYAATKKIKDEQDKVEAEREALLEVKRIEAENVIREAREKLKKAINQLKSKKDLAQAHVTAQYAEVTNKLMSHFAPEGNKRASVDLKELEEGQLVYHRRLKQKGIVQSVDAMAGRACVFLGNVKVSSEARDLEMVRDDQATNVDQKQRPAFWNFKDFPTRELNVVGYRVNDAIPLIDKAIDRALVDGQLSLRIIHGFGTGRLRQAIRLHLKDLPFVKSFCSAESSVGGGAITIVELS